METIEKVHKSKQIDKIKITDKGVTVDWTETVMTETYKPSPNGEGPDELVGETKNFLHHSTGGDFLPHKDFMDAMKMLRKPVIQACEWGDFKHFDKFRIYGVAFAGESDEATVVITYSKEIEWNGKVLPAMNTQPIPLGDNDKFDTSSQIDKFCKNIIDEAWAYLGGKHAENPQLSLEFEGGDKLKLNVEK